MLKIMQSSNYCSPDFLHKRGRVTNSYILCTYSCIKIYAVTILHIIIIIEMKGYAYAYGTGPTDACFLDSFFSYIGTSFLLAARGGVATGQLLRIGVLVHLNQPPPGHFSPESFTYLNTLILYNHKHTYIRLRSYNLTFTHPCHIGPIWKKIICGSD